MSKTVIDAVTGEERPLKIALDFDGVLHSYSSGWTGQIPFDLPVEGAVVFCEQLLMEGFEVSIYTTRVHPELCAGKIQRFIHYSEKTPTGWVPRSEQGTTLAEEAIRDWLRHWDFPTKMFTCEITHKKLHTDLLIDDRAFRFTGDFTETLEYIEKVNPMLETWAGQQ